MINLKNIFNFFEIKQYDTSFKVSWLVSENLPYFQGHFPKNPILPAIALLDFIKACFSSDSFSFNKKIYQSEFQDIKSAKFCEIIKPNDQITAQFTLNPETNYWTALFENQNKQLVSKIRFKLLKINT